MVRRGHGAFCDQCPCDRPSPRGLAGAVISFRLKKVACELHEGPAVVIALGAFLSFFHPYHSNSFPVSVFIFEPFRQCSLAAFKIRFVILEAIFVAILIAAVPIGAHGVVLGISLGNLGVIAWFWYNSVRSVEVTVDGGLRFWIGNFEVDVPFDKIMSMRRISGECSLIAPNLLPHRGYLTSPTDGVAIVTSVPSTPFWMWPRSAGRPERRLGPFTCPRLIVVFSPTGGSLSFIREVEAEMRGDGSGGEGRAGRVQPPAYVAAAGGSGGLGLQPPVAATADLIDV